VKETKQFFGLDHQRGVRFFFARMNAAGKLKRAENHRRKRVLCTTITSHSATRNKSNTYQCVECLLVRRIYARRCTATKGALVSTHHKNEVKKKNRIKESSRCLEVLVRVVVCNEMEQFGDRMLLLRAQHGNVNRAHRQRITQWQT
jgi:hypothetical protein